MCGSLISAAHFPHGLCLTPLYLLLLSPAAVSSPAVDADSDPAVAVVVDVATVEAVVRGDTTTMLAASS